MSSRVAIAVTATIGLAWLALALANRHDTDRDHPSFKTALGLAIAYLGLAAGRIWDRRQAQQRKADS